MSEHDDFDDLDFEIEGAADAAPADDSPMEAAITAASDAAGSDLERRLRQMAHAQGIPEDDALWLIVQMLVEGDQAGTRTLAGVEAAAQAAAQAAAVAGEAVEVTAVRIDAIPEQIRRGGDQAGEAAAARMREAAQTAAADQREALAGLLNELAGDVRGAGDALRAAAEKQRAATIKDWAAQAEQVIIRAMRAQGERKKLGTFLLGGLLMPLMMAGAVAVAAYFANQAGYFIPPHSPGAVRVIPGVAQGRTVVTYRGRVYRTDCPASAVGAHCLIFQP